MTASNWIAKQLENYECCTQRSIKTLKNDLRNPKNPSEYKQIKEELARREEILSEIQNDFLSERRLVELGLM